MIERAVSLALLSDHTQLNQTTFVDDPRESIESLGTLHEKENVSLECLQLQIVCVCV